MKNVNLYTIVFALLTLFIVLYYSFRKWDERKEIENTLVRFPKLIQQMNLIPKSVFIWKIIVYPFITLLLCLTLFNPHLREENLGGQNVLSGVDILFVVDVSLSMYAVDTAPNRLSRFKEVVLSLTPELTGNRMGIVTFAGAPFLYCPMTSDIAAFSDYVRGLDTDMIPDTGTNLGKAIDKANEILKSKKILKNRIIVLVTDGEDKSQPSKSLESGELLVWGVGTKEGGPIFYQDEMGKLSGFVSKDRKLYPNATDPNVVISKLEEGYLKRLSSKNDGEYYNISMDPQAPRLLLDKINSIEKNSNKVLKEIARKDGYQYFLGLALFLLLVDILFFEIMYGIKLKKETL
jgi:Ca-activated chloride channel homolog